jgi:hypothetical protein
MDRRARSRKMLGVVGVSGAGRSSMFDLFRAGGAYCLQKRLRCVLRPHFVPSKWKR